MDKEKIEKAVKMILEAVGEDPEREGLKETPERVARMYEEILSGYNDDAAKHLSKVFPFMFRSPIHLVDAERLLMNIRNVTSRIRRTLGVQLGTIDLKLLCSGLTLSIKLSV